tara:strand:+ start:1482 stop:2096 length:615 start_codon:yes stop_codon:yes gene_type:complete
MIGIIEYGLGNISAFANIYKKLDVPHKILRSSKDFKEVNKLILPGVGAFDNAMNLFSNSGMREVTEDLVLQEKMPILGVCVGMQMMAESSEEGDLEGLNWIKGKVVKFKSENLEPGSPMPHMGWNKLNLNIDDDLTDGLQHTMFYFLHSYYLEPKNQENILSKTNYGSSFCSVIKNKNIYGMQCHPEKSHDSGIKFLKNFSNIT